MKTLRPTEHQEQQTLIQWAKLMEPQIPELGLLFAIPNGGFRHWKTAGYLKAEGVKAGVPDLCLPVPDVTSALKTNYHGLFIEMKRPDGPKPTLAQVWWQEQLKGQGYQVAVCYGFEEAQTALLTYLGKNGPHEQRKGEPHTTIIIEEVDV